jgi:hypothetical protein
MEPNLTTAPHLLAVLDELRQREPIFHRAELGNDFAAMTDPEFWEVGASGRRYSREFILQTLDERVSRRATLWRRSMSGWTILYHQGTLVDSAA